MKKKLIAMFAAAVTAAAWSATQTVGGYEWNYLEKPDGTVKIEKTFAVAVSPAPTGALTIPSTLGGKTVSEIGDYALVNCSSMTSVSIPSSVTRVGDAAFYNCTGLTSVTIPNNVTYIGVLAFFNCTGLTSISLPSKLTTIGAQAFFNCTSWAGSVTIPSGVTSINDKAFKCCSKLTSVTLPSGITEIDKEVFSQCTKLASVNIPSGVTVINNNAFFNCSSLTSISIPSGVTAIGTGAFNGCSALAGTLTLPSGVKKINANVFYGCGKLTGVSLSSKTTSIGVDAFWGCVKITSMTIPSKVTNIGARAFQQCTMLKTVTFKGNAPETVGENAFYYVGSGCTANVPYGSTGWGVGDGESWNGLTLKFAAAPTYTVEFDGNGATSGAMAEQTIIRDTAQALTANAFARSGYLFTGWNTKADGSGAAYANGASVTNLGAKNTTVTLYAQWKDNRGTATFDANGGKASSTSIKKELNTALGTLPTATRDGYIFNGWFTAKSGGLKISADTKLTKNVTYYAQWTVKQKKYMVNFNANGGTGTMKDQSVNYGQSTALTANVFTRKGYTFKGWATDKKSTSVKYKDKAKVKNLTDKDGETVTLYAVWKANSYKIVFNKNGGKGSAPSTVTATYNKEVKLPANTFKRTDYTFLGWSTNKKATAATYKNKAKVKNLSAKDGAKVTLYAIWQHNQYTVVFNGNGATSGSMAKQSIDTKAKKALSKNGFKREGYDFKGWATSKTGKVVYKNGAKVKDLAKNGKTVKLYAVWSLPTWAFGEFNGWCTYVEDEINYNDGVATASISALGELKGTFTIEDGLGGTDKVKFSASKFSGYEANVSTYDYLNLIGYNIEMDGDDIVKEIQSGVAPSKVTVYVYSDVAIKLPGGENAKIDLAMASWSYDGKGLRGFISVTSDAAFNSSLQQNLFKSKHLPVPTFDGTPTVTLPEEVFARGLDYSVNKLTATFKSNGDVTITGYEGKTKKWTVVTPLTLYSYRGGVYGGGCDFMSPSGRELWFDGEFKPAKNGKVAKGGITISDED